MESPVQHSSLPYRRDIDGLRAIAVMCVVIFHLASNNLSGGFIGVDVFFVISGYLISSILLRDLESNSFTFAKFYERRVRRIAPALLAVLIGISIAALVFLFPYELTSYAKSLVGAVVSVSNFYFLKHSGYFDQLANTNPLLHTWSLAVEEQFYIFFPVVLIVLRKYAWQWRKVVIAAMCGLSFGLSWFLVTTERSRTFYIIDTRAWELLTGALLALSILPVLQNRWLRDAISLLGLAAILGSAVIYKATTPFPGPAALAPCLGAAFIIWAGQVSESIAGRLLSIRPFVFLGTISYSLYLIHWPVIVFSLMSRLYSVSPSNHLYYKLLRLGIAGACIVVSYLSYKYIEQPFRDRRLTRVILFRTSAVVAAGLVVFSFFLISTGGLPKRFPVQAVVASRYLEFDPRPFFREGPCFITQETTYSEFRRDECLHIDQRRPNYLLLGDSHAAQYWYEMKLLASTTNVLQATATGCKPFLKGANRDLPDCRRLIDFIYHEFLVQQPVRAVILSARWGDEDLPSLRSTLTWLKSKGIRVILVGPSMEYAQPLPRLIAASIVNGNPKGIFSEQINEKLKLDPQMRSLASEIGMEYLSPESVFCKAPECEYTTLSGAPVLFDHDHLTPEGSAAAIQAWEASGSLK